MNDIHSSTESSYKPRWIEPLITEAVRDFPVVVVTGARQTGKSTLLRNASPVKNWRYLTLDDYDVRRTADTHPEALWAGVENIVIDEVQHSPRLLSAVKLAVDSKRARMRFVLSGSANLLLMRRVGESLAGRAVYFTLLPMTLGELSRRNPPDLLSRLFRGEPPPASGKFAAAELFPSLARGGMPPLMSLETAQAVTRWWEGYVSTYLERDLREISQVDSLVDFRRVMTALAHRNGRLLNQTEVSRDTGVSQPTIHRYVNLLETTCLAERLPAFAVNRTKRLIKAPKFYWMDTGLVSFLCGFHDPGELVNNKEAGTFFETFVLLHLKVLCELQTPKARLHYWRTTTGKEVDFVVEQGRNLLAIEVKLANAPGYADIENLRLFLRDHPKTAQGVLVYGGHEIRRMDEKIVAMPWTALAGAP